MDLVPQARVLDDSSVVDSGVLVLVDAAGDRKDGQSVVHRLVVEKMQHLEIVLAPVQESVGVHPEENGLDVVGVLVGLIVFEQVREQYLFACIVVVVAAAAARMEQEYAPSVVELDVTAARVDW